MPLPDDTHPDMPLPDDTHQDIHHHQLHNSDKIIVATYVLGVEIARTRESFQYKITIHKISLFRILQNQEYFTYFIEETSNGNSATYNDTPVIA